MTQIKIGSFPGELKSYAVEDGITVREALEMAGIKSSSEQEIKLDGEVVDLDSEISSYNSLLLVTKRLKGAR